MANILHSVKFIGRISSLDGLKLLPAAVNTSVTQIAKLHSAKDTINPLPAKLYPPWDYKNKPYHWMHQIYEHTTKRLDENSKIIIVEGSIGTDKVRVGKKIAEEFDMLFLPDVPEEAIFVNENGFDQRELNPRLGEDRFYDLKDLYTAKQPQDVLGFGRTQLEMFKKRFFNYNLALRHLLNTGQGVVIERSYWSDRCFADAMSKCGYFTREGKTYYNKVYKQPQYIWMPHVVLYIDASVDQCKELIKKRNNPIEKDSPLLTDQYLQTIEDTYKTKVLPRFKIWGEVLTYDLDEVENMDEILFEMQKLNLEPPCKTDKLKFLDWYEDKEWKWNYKRQMTATDYFYDRKFFLGMEDAFLSPEICIQDHDNYDLVVNCHPSNYWEKGFNPDTDNYMFKRQVLLNNRFQKVTA
ncbi:NADH dehydrogenase [ubiquinone] 1 alpha subcomplex subunit 10, mitochondrial-like [Mytilus californianus]|uniref:NADH dehydrogenase [ubiquinone] 1 alpha subcomplex subunit 10, mitochondrial-like n=1 Tax=Mytilus californianus TaxID=6549 RepID=UPI0022458C01|nr:NADH dehydrogenase [ubiquinone] 1 alpha subcomplex subunit 10, mitochondrial-like [Mytilus californianus]